MKRSAEIRAAVLAYHRIEELMKQPLPPYLRERLSAISVSIQDDCHVASSGSGPSRWARGVVGPVLAAGLGATFYMRDFTLHEALAAFGFGSDRPLTNRAAWDLIKPWALDQELDVAALATVQRSVTMRLTRLPKQPAPADVLVELTRPRSGAFPVQVARWLSDHFRTRPDDSKYAALYRSSLADLVALNARGEMMQLTSATLPHDRLTREEWEGVIHGRIPQPRLEARAAHHATRRFLADYWEHWNADTATHSSLAV